ncbi:MAG: kelch repeat-containing protein [Betaproteobacteria bacterium]|jgi:hypothetical protein
MFRRTVLAGLMLAAFAAQSSDAAALGATNACTWNGNFIAAGTMAGARAGHVATPLANGDVLVTGGSSPTTTVRTAERFAVGTGTFTALPDMTTERYFHTATRLPSGKVLIAAGSSGALTLGVTNSAEIYDPNANTFTATGALAKARLFHTATMLSDGSVLIIGGTGANGVAIGEVERYDPGTGQFQVVATLGTPRANHAVARLDGTTTDEVLVIGGRGPNGTTGAVEIVSYDASTHVATVRSAASLAEARQDHTATVLHDGSVLVIGGGDASNQPVAGVERWVVNGFTSVGPLHHPRRDHHATLLPTGQVLVAGGLDLHAVPATELYTPGSGFRDIGNLTTPRFYAAAAALPTGQVLYVGGFDVTEVTTLAGAELYDPFWAGIGPMNQRREDHSATLLPDGRVLLAGGGDGAGGARDTAELFDPVAGTFALVGMNGARSRHTATAFADGTVLLAGGQNVGMSFLGSADIFRATTGTFTSTPAMASPRLSHAATLLADGRALVTGGFGPTNWSSTEAFTLTAGTAQGSFAAGPTLTRDRMGHALVRLDNDHVLAIGGLSNVAGGISYSVEEFDPATGAFALWPNASWLVTNRREHVAVAVPGQSRALVAGGLTSGYAPTNSFELIPQGGQGRMLWPRFLHALSPTLASDTTFWAIGGHAAYSGSPLAAVDRLDASDLSTVVAMPELGTGRARHTATLLTDGRVLVAGGRRDMDSVTTTAEISKSTLCALPPPHRIRPGRKVTFEKVYLRIRPQNFAIRALIGNGSRRNNPAFALRYDLVRRDGGERRIVIGTLRIPKLGPGERSRLSASLPLPAGMPDGAYDIQACVVPQAGLAGKCFEIPGGVVREAKVRSDHFPHLPAPSK